MADFEPNNFIITCKRCGSESAAIYLDSMLNSCGWDRNDNYIELEVVCLNCSFTEQIFSQQM